MPIYPRIPTASQTNINNAYPYNLVKVRGRLFTVRIIDAGHVSCFRNLLALSSSLAPILYKAK